MDRRKKRADSCREKGRQPVKNLKLGPILFELFVIAGGATLVSLAVGRGWALAVGIYLLVAAICQAIRSAGQRTV